MNQVESEGRRRGQPHPALVQIQVDPMRFEMLHVGIYYWFETRDGNRIRFSSQQSMESEAHKLVIPRGFTTDGASVPRLLWSLLSPFELGPAYIAHDFLYAHAGTLPRGSHWYMDLHGWRLDERPWSRGMADDLFDHMMRESEIPSWRRIPAAAAVRWFGGDSWRDRTHEFDMNVSNGRRGA